MEYSNDFGVVRNGCTQKFLIPRKHCNAPLLLELGIFAVAFILEGFQSF